MHRDIYRFYISIEKKRRVYKPDNTYKSQVTMRFDEKMTLIEDYQESYPFFLNFFSNFFSLLFKI